MENHSDVRRMPCVANDTSQFAVCLEHHLARPESGGPHLLGDATSVHGADVYLYHAYTVAWCPHRSGTLDLENASSGPCPYVAVCGFVLHPHPDVLCADHMSCALDHAAGGPTLHLCGQRTDPDAKHERLLVRISRCQTL
jgi:hypothetical protein